MITLQQLWDGPGYLQPYGDTIDLNVEADTISITEFNYSENYEIEAKDFSQNVTVFTDADTIMNLLDNQEIQGAYVSSPQINGFLDLSSTTISRENDGLCRASLAIISPLAYAQKALQYPRFLNVRMANVNKSIYLQDIVYFLATGTFMSSIPSSQEIFGVDSYPVDFTPLYMAGSPAYSEFWTNSSNKLSHEETIDAQEFLLKWVIFDKLQLKWNYLMGKYEWVDIDLSSKPVSLRLDTNYLQAKQSYKPITRSFNKGIRYIVNTGYFPWEEKYYNDILVNELGITLDRTLQGYLWGGATSGPPGKAGQSGFIYNLLSTIDVNNQTISQRYLNIDQGFQGSYPLQDPSKYDQSEYHTFWVDAFNTNRTRIKLSDTYCSCRLKGFTTDQYVQKSPSDAGLSFSGKCVEGTWRLYFTILSTEQGGLDPNDQGTTGGSRKNVFYYEYDTSSGQWNSTIQSTVQGSMVNDEIVNAINNLSVTSKINDDGYIEEVIVSCTQQTGIVGPFYSIYLIYMGESADVDTGYSYETGTVQGIDPYIIETERPYWSFLTNTGTDVWAVSDNQVFPDLSPLVYNKRTVVQVSTEGSPDEITADGVYEIPTGLHNNFLVPRQILGRKNTKLKRNGRDIVEMEFISVNEVT